MANKITNRFPVQYPKENRIYRKREFYEMFHRGVFGNHGPMWQTYQEMHDDPYYQEHRPLVAIRTKVPGQHCEYNIPYSRIYKVYRTFLDTHHYKPSELQFSEMLPQKYTTLQGYVMQSEQHYDLHHSFSPLPMRQALSHGSYATGLLALGLLKKYLNQNSYDWLQALFDLFPEAVIEFSCLSINWGTVPHHNTVFWEVRNY